MSKVDQTGFQLDKKELTKDLPLMLKGIAGSIIDAINSMDANHDGKADIAQIAPYVFKALPVLVALAPFIDAKALKEWFLNHDFVKDKEQAEALLTQLQNTVKEAVESATKK